MSNLLEMLGLSRKQEYPKTLTEMHRVKFETAVKYFRTGRASGPCATEVRMEADSLLQKINAAKAHRQRSVSVNYMDQAILDAACRVFGYRLSEERRAIREDSTFDYDMYSTNKYLNL